MAFAEQLTFFFRRTTMTSSENDHSAVINARDLAGNQSTASAQLKEHLHVAQNARAPDDDLSGERAAEHGGQAGLEPTRYGDWEKKGRCTDF